MLFKLEPDMELYSLRELALNPADVFLENLTVPNLLLHLTRLTRISATGSRIITLLHTPETELPAEHEEARGEPIQPVNCPQVLQVVFLGQDENHSVVPVPAARVNLEMERHVVNSDLSFYNNLALFRGEG